jgi:hypothetical protein
MLSFPAGVRLYLATEPTDLRKSFSGLSMLVEHTFGLDAMAGHLFVFLNRRGNQVRILFWDRDGFCIVAKKLYPSSTPDSSLTPRAYFRPHRTSRKILYVDFCSHAITPPRSSILCVLAAGCFI